MAPVEFDKNSLTPEKVEAEIESLENFRSNLGELIIKANQQYSSRLDPSGFKVPVKEIRRYYMESMKPEQDFEEDIYSRFNAEEQSIDNIMKSLENNDTVGPYTLNRLIHITDSTKNLYDEILEELDDQ